MSFRNKSQTLKAQTYSWEQALKTTFKIVILVLFFTMMLNMSFRNKSETLTAQTYSWEQSLETMFKIVLLFYLFSLQYIKYIVQEYM